MKNFWAYRKIFLPAIAIWLFVAAFSLTEGFAWAYFIWGFLTATWIQIIRLYKEAIRLDQEEGIG